MASVTTQIACSNCCLVALCARDGALVEQTVEARQVSFVHEDEAPCEPKPPETGTIFDEVDREGLEIRG